MLERAESNKTIRALSWGPLGTPCRVQTIRNESATLYPTIMKPVYFQGRIKAKATDRNNKENMSMIVARPILICSRGSAVVWKIGSNNIEMDCQEINNLAFENLKDKVN